jgi:hypothetical protein
MQAGIEHAPAGAEPGDWPLNDVVLECLDVIQDFPELPEVVRAAGIARIERRSLDRRLLRQLISQSPPPNSEIGWSTRILRREESLLPHLGKMLFCALIRLPGVQYTVEVDLVEKMVVHWEWQPV